MTKHPQHTPELDQAMPTPLDRRDVLTGAAALGVAAAAAAAPTTARAEMAANTGAAPHQKLIDASVHCYNASAVCLNHCIKVMSTGDTSLKDCIRRVAETMPMCTALAELAALDSGRLKEVAAVCMKVCDDCEKECRKHEKHHEPCRECAESCAEVIAECKKLIAT